MEQLIGYIPFIRLIFPDKGWYQRLFTPERLVGPYPTEEAASILAGDPIPPYEIEYHLIMPPGTYDIRKPVKIWWE